MRQVSPGHGPDILHLPCAAPQLAGRAHGPVPRHRRVPPLRVRHHGLQASVECVTSASVTRVLLNAYGYIANIEGKAITNNCLET